MPKESSIQSSALRYLNSLPKCIAENVSGNSAQSGRADINGCIQGRSFRIELKTPDHGNVPSQKQLYDLLKWQKAGSIVGVMYSLSEIKAVFGKTGLLVPSYQHDFSGLCSFICTDPDDKRIEAMLEEYI